MHHESVGSNKMKRSPLRFASPVLIVTAITTVVWVNAGDINPPAGPVTLTMRTLDQIEARIIVNATNTPGDGANTFIISAPGSYFFPGNITGEANKHGISIQANDVTLDLNGFALISGGGTVRGVNVPAAQTDLSVRNGSVRGWAGGGVRADTSVTLAEKLRCSDNTGATGLVVGNGSMIKDCVASGNGTGFFAPDRTQVSSCIATVNTGAGFDCENFVTIIDCTSSRNNGNGIVVKAACSVIRCSATRHLNNNGIVAGTDCTIAECITGSNVVDGIAVGSGSTVRNCTASANSHGISFASNCHITGNASDANGIGIYTEGNGNRVDGNSCTANTSSGFLINGANNLVVRNSGHGNLANFNIVTNSASGPVVNMTGGGTIVSTSPWANFSY